jgi:CheY-like chemotaxis protein
VPELRLALRHLYDPIALRKSPLAAVFALDANEDPPAALRDILTAAIESLKPGHDVPSRMRAWRIYELLYARYIEQFTQKEVATELGLSIRHLRREETAALEALAAYLWRHHKLGDHWPSPSAELALLDQEATPPDAQTPTQEQELDWLRESLPNEAMDLQNLIQEVLELARPLADKTGVRLGWKPANSLPNVIAQPAAIRQALLTTFTALIDLVPGGQVFIRPEVRVSEVHVHVWPEHRHTGPGLSGTEAEQLAVAEQLFALSGSSLDIEPGQDGKRPLLVQIVLPAQERTSVLVIDDNADTLRLLERYLSNTRYRFVGTCEPRQAVQLATDVQPKMIVLDVMLPEIDGWEILGRLHGHPQTKDIPVIVCTILPHEQLAHALGAADFCRKPISRQAFLTALDRQFSLLRQESR